MIGYYVDVGYSTEFVTNFDDITWLDKNRPFTVLQAVEKFKNFEGGKFDETYEYAVTVLGDQVHTIYNVPPRIAEIGKSMQAYDRVHEFFPSISASFPNSFSYWKSNLGSSLIFYVYFKSLEKCISTASSGVYTVANGKLTYAGDEVFTIGLDQYYSTTSSTGEIYNSVIKVPIIIGEITDSGLNGEITRLSIGSQFDYGGVREASYFRPSTYRKTSLLFTKKPDFTYIGPDNPYEPGGPSGPTDPDLPPGTFDDESDPIPDSPLPTLSAANTGFTRIYNPTLSQVQALARYLWTDPDVIQTIWNHIKQFLENPIEAIIGFNLVPVPVPDGGTENFALMYIDTGVSMTVAANQFVDLDCGTVDLKRYYGSALDQSPYTKVSCFLPYIGTVNLNTDEVMGTTLQVKYRVDIVSGSCVAKIFVDGNCLYQYSGHCAITIPISSVDFSSYVSAAISVGKLAGAALIGGAGAPAAIAAAEAAQQTGAVTTIETVETARNPSTGRQITTGTTTQTITAHQQPKSITKASFAGLSAQNITNTVGGVVSSKPHIEHSGSFSGNSGYLGVRRPFLIIERPNMCMPENYQALNGFPAMITMELSTCKGFTRVQQVQLTGMGRATNPEQAEILELLKSGVIL